MCVCVCVCVGVWVCVGKWMGGCGMWVGVGWVGGCMCACVCSCVYAYKLCYIAVFSLYNVSGECWTTRVV